MLVLVRLSLTKREQTDEYCPLLSRVAGFWAAKTAPVTCRVDALGATSGTPVLGSAPDRCSALGKKKKKKAGLVEVSVVT